MRAAPADRYGTVDQLQEDLKRYQGNLPVRARRSSLRYHAGKFLRRHTIAAVLATVILAVVFGFAAALLTQNGKTRLERDRAKRESRAKEEVIDFAVRIFALADPYTAPGKLLTVKDALTRSESWLAEAALEADVEVDMRAVIGRVFLAIGLTDSALAQFEKSLEIIHRIHGENSAEAAHMLSLVAEAMIPEQREAAFQEGQRAVARIRQHVGAAAELVAPLNRLVGGYCYWSEYELAAAPSQEALSLALRWFGEDHEETAVALTNRAAVMKSQGDLEDAAEMFQRALNVQRRSLPANHPLVADVWSNIALIENGLGHRERAAEILLDVLGRQREAFGGAHWKIAQTLNNLSAVLWKLDRRDESLQRLGEAVETLYETQGRDDPATIRTEILLARRMVQAGRPADAQRRLERCLESWRSVDLGAHQKLITQAEEVLEEAKLARS